jgi:hypothetical protein
MKAKEKHLLLFTLSGLSMALLISMSSRLAHSQSGGSFTIKPSVVPGGGGTSVNGSVRATGSAGQSMAATSSNNGITVEGGFWQAVRPCLSLSQTHQSFAASGGTGSVNVASDAMCNWSSASNDPSFIKITSGGSGTGDGTVTYSVAANAGSTIRQGTLTVAGELFNIFQGINFTDVPLGSTFYTEVGQLSARGVTLGCGGGNFCPADAVTREQMAAFILRARGEFDPPQPPSQRFNDVPPENIFYSFVDRLAVLEITLGCTADHTMYCPHDPVLREQMAAFLLRGLGEFNPPAPGSQRFNDVPPSMCFTASSIDWRYCRSL